MDQLKTANFDIQATVESNTTFKWVFEASSLADMERMEKCGGETRDTLISWTQRPPYGAFDNDDAISPDRVYPKHFLEPATVNATERVGSRFPRNAILAHSAHPLRAFVRSRTDSGLTQYAGQWTVVECEYPAPYDEYQARANTPLPTEHPGCITLGAKPEPTPPLKPTNGPLPVPPASPTANVAIVERLKALQEAICNQKTE